MSKSSAKQGPPAVGKKYKVKKVIEKPKPAQKSAAKKVVKAEKKANPGGISGKYTGLKEKKPKAAASVKTDGPKTDAAKKPTGQKRSNGGNHGNAVVKISSLPHGFYEDQLKGYFTQFGTVTNVKVVRSLKTGRSKGVAFVEFSVPEVAEIAAETMNNYLLFKSLLKTEYIPPNKVKPGLFTKVVEVVTKPDGTTSVQSAVITKRKQEVRKLNAKPSEGQAKKRKNRLENQLKLKNKFLKKLGVDLDVKSLVEGQVDLTTPVKAPSTAAKAKKTQNITVKVSNDEPVAEKKEAAPKKAAPGKKSKPAPAEKKPTPVILPKETKKAVEKQEAKQEEAKNQQKKNNKAKKAAKGKNAQDTVAIPVTPQPVKKAPAEKKQKKVQDAPKTTEPAKKVAPAKAKKEAPVKPNKPVAKAPAAKKAPVKASPQKEKKVAPKKSLEKKKAVKLSPKKKSVK